MSTAVATTHFDQTTVIGWLDAMLQSLTPLSEADDPAIIGIRRGGVDVARYLHSGLSLDTPLGELNIGFYRDDFSSIGLHPVVGPSHVPFDVEGRHIILVDDVLGTGRTVRAAMNEIFDYGRPARITLAVLVERSEHELPIRADVIGHRLSLQAHEHVRFDAAGMTVQLESRQ